MGHNLSEGASKKERVPTETKVKSQSWDTPAFSICRLLETEAWQGVDTHRLNDSRLQPSIPSLSKGDNPNKYRQFISFFRSSLQKMALHVADLQNVARPSLMLAAWKLARFRRRVDVSHSWSPGERRHMHRPASRLFGDAWLPRCPNAF
jgi:hypothetical protein